MSKVGQKSADVWPKAAEKKYERIVELGHGNFGAVWLARQRNDSSSHPYVAVKNVDISRPNLRAYAEREIAILSEMNHPCVIRLIQAYKATKANPNCRLVVMSLANGPNLSSVVETGGAIGLPLARLVSRHLVSAIAYLHTRAVVHRDIKTDNCTLCRMDINPTTAKYDWKHDDSIWSDGEDAQEAVDSGNWRVILVDFGMARALSPKDMGLVAEDDNKESDEDDEAIEAVPASSSASRPRRQTSKGKRGSVSRLMVKRLSALGTYDFAAPEISNDYRKKTKEDMDKIKSLTKCIADYGLIVDAYSLGTTLREVLTGVPPHVEDAAAFMQKKSKQSLKSKLTKKRQRHFCTLKDLPSHAASLIKKLSEVNQRKRMTVRESQNHPWIAGTKAEGKYQLPQGDIDTSSGSKIEFLKCATDGTFDME